MSIQYKLFAFCLFHSLAIVTLSFFVCKGIITQIYIFLHAFALQVCFSVEFLRVHIIPQPCISPILSIATTFVWKSFSYFCSKICRWNDAVRLLFGGSKVPQYPYPKTISTKNYERDQVESQNERGAFK